MKLRSCLLLILLLGLLAGCAKQEMAPLPEAVVQKQPVQKLETAHIHHYVTTETALSCTEDGIVEYRCDCGDVYTGAVQKAAGHQYEDEVIEPTIASEGCTRHTCAVCGDVYEDEIQPMLPDGIEDGTFFDDAAFVGDSIVLSMKTHAQLEQCFGDALFLCRASFSIRSAALHTMDLTYRGARYTVAEALQACGAKKVFIQLGMNDIATFTADQSMDYWKTVIEEIRSLCPDMLIFIQAGTPIYDERGKLTNANMDSYNEDLKAVAEETGCFFVDIATPLKDENNFLKKEYCSDAYCHMSIEGCAVWERTLKDYLLEHKGEFA